MQPLREKLLEIETEMRRLGYWSEGEKPFTDEAQLYASLPFERWLQFVFLPALQEATESGDFSKVPRYRIGLAALRNYDYHSGVPEAQHLMALCFELEKLIAPMFKPPIA